VRRSHRRHSGALLLAPRPQRRRLRLGGLRPHRQDRLIELLRVSKRGTPRKDVLIELPTRAVADEIAQAAKAREQMQQALEAQPQVHAHILAMIQKMSEGGDGFSGGQFVVTLGSAVSP
jgi:hypothetical protein